MKKISKVVASVLAVSQLFTGAMAMNIDTALTSYDFDNRIFHIEGTTEFANQPVKLEILKRDIGFGDFSDSDDLLYISQVYSDDSKNFVFDVEVEEIGVFAYRVSELGSDKVYSEGFATYTDETARLAIENYMGKVDKSIQELDRLICDYYPSMNVDLNLYCSLGDDIKEPMLELINNTACEDARAFSDFVAYSVAVALITSAEDKFAGADLTEQFASQLGISEEVFYKDFSVLERDERAEIVSGVKADSPYATFGENLKNKFIIKEVENSVWNAVAEVLDKYLDCDGVKMLEKYSKSAKKYAVTELKDAIKKEKIIKAEDMYDFLKESASDYKSSDSSSGTSGGGSGSRGSSGGSYTAPVVDVEPATPVETPKVESGSFSDTADVPWASEAIAYLYRKGVINGRAENIFAPNDSVTREEFVKMIILAFDIELTDGECSFEDVKKDEWYSRYVSTAFEKGIINGSSDTHFGTGEFIKRQDMAQILYNVLKITGVELPEGASLAYGDKDSISDYAADAVSVLSAMGCLSGDDKGNVMPLKNSTRAEASKLIYSVVTTTGR